MYSPRSSRADLDRIDQNSSRLSDRSFGSDRKPLRLPTAGRKKFDEDKRSSSPILIKDNDQEFVRSVFDIFRDQREDSIINKKNFEKALNYAGIDIVKDRIEELWSENTEQINLKTFRTIFNEEKSIDERKLEQAFENLYGKDDSNWNKILNFDIFYKDLTTKGDRFTENEFEKVRTLLGTSAGKIDLKKLLRNIEETKKTARKDILKRSEEKEHERKFSPSNRSPSPAKNSKIIDFHRDPVENSLKTDKRAKRRTIKGAFFCENLDESSVEHFSLSYAFEVNEPTSICFVVEPSLSRFHRDKSFDQIDVRILIFKVDRSTKKLNLIHCSSTQFEKKTFIQIDELRPGSYEIVPMTFGSRLKPTSDRLKKFKPKTKLRQKEKNGFEMTDDYREALSYIFSLFDFQGNKFLDRHEYNLWTQRTSNDSITDEDWETIRMNLKLDVDESISLNNFLKLNQYEVENDATTEDDLWKGLHSMGFNNNFEIDSMCPFTLTSFVQLEEFSLKPIGFVRLSEVKKKLLNFLKNQAKRVRLNGSNLNIFQYEDDCGLILFAENQEEKFCRISMKFLEKKNVVLNVETDSKETIKVEILSKRSEILLFANRLDDQQEMKLKFSLDGAR